MTRHHDEPSWAPGAFAAASLSDEFVVEECAGCLEWLHECVCPTLPLDEYRDLVNVRRLQDAEGDA